MTEQMNEQAKTRLPFWSKLLMLAVIIGLLGTFSGAIATALFLKKVGSDAFNPTHMRTALREVMQFPDQLPEGYTQQMGLSSFGYVFCGVSHADSKQQLALLCGSIAVDKSKSAADIAKDAFDHFGVNTASVSARFYEELNHGEEDVLGEKMAYLTGKAKDAEGRDYEGLVGCIIPKTAQKVILVYAVQPKGKPFDLCVLLNFLRNAKAF